MLVCHSGPRKYARKQYIDQFDVVTDIGTDNLNELQKNQCIIDDSFPVEEAFSDALALWEQTRTDGCFRAVIGMGLTAWGLTGFGKLIGKKGSFRAANGLKTTATLEEKAALVRIVLEKHRKSFQKSNGVEYAKNNKFFDQQVHASKNGSVTFQGIDYSDFDTYAKAQVKYSSDLIDLLDEKYLGETARVRRKVRANTKETALAPVISSDLNLIQNSQVTDNLKTLGVDHGNTPALDYILSDLNWDTITANWKKKMKTAHSDISGQAQGGMETNVAYQDLKTLRSRLKKHSTQHKLLEHDGLDVFDEPGLNDFHRYLRNGHIQTRDLFSRLTGKVVSDKQMDAYYTALQASNPALTAAGAVNAFYGIDRCKLNPETARTDFADIQANDPSKLIEINFEANIRETFKGKSNITVNMNSKQGYSAKYTRKFLKNFNKHVYKPSKYSNVNSGDEAPVESLQDLYNLYFQK